MLDEVNRKQRLVLVACILGSFVVFLDGSVVNVALPAIQSDLGGGIAAQQWVIDAYLLTLGSLILVAGSLSDVFGRERVFAAGLMGFGVTSVLCAIAPSAALLIAARALQGVAGALLVPSSLALIVAEFDERSRGRAIGRWTAWTGTAFIIGPLLGGGLVEAGSWRWVFAINVAPVAATLLVLARVGIQRARRVRGAIDIVGAALCSLGLGGVTFALIEWPASAMHRPTLILFLWGGVLALAAFLWFERFAAHPMLDLRLFCYRNFAVGNLATLLIYAGLGAATFLVTLFLQQVAGYSPIAAGLSLLPVTLILLGLSPYFGRKASTHGPRWFMAAGPLLTAGGMVLMARIEVRAEYVRTLLPGVILFGFGLAMTVAPLTTAILGDVGEQRAGIGSAVNNAVSRIATLLAIAGIGLVVAASFRAQVDERLAADQLSAVPQLSVRARRLALESRNHPLDLSPVSRIESGPEARALNSTLEQASLQAFRVALSWLALLLVAGGIVSGVGIKNASKEGDRGGSRAPD